VSEEGMKMRLTFSKENHLQESKMSIAQNQMTIAKKNMYWKDNKVN